MRSGHVWTAALLALSLAACRDGGSPVGPSPKDLQVAVQGGDDQVWTPSAPLPKPLQVVVTNAASKAPVSGVSVSWTITGGGSLSPTTSITDSSGIASTTVTLGSALGAYTVTATFAGNIGSPASFKLEATNGATISGVAPTSARAGDTVTITGTGFSTVPQHNYVLFGGVRGAIATATATQLKVVVPLCVPAGTVNVVVVLGPTTSTPASLAVSGSSATSLNLAVGQVAVLTDPAAQTCAKLDPGSYLVVVENASDQASAFTTPMDFQLLGLGPVQAASAFYPPLARITAVLAAGDIATRFEGRLRQMEAQMLANARISGGLARASVSPASPAPLPSVGDTTSFSVLNSITADPPTFSKVRAVVKVVTASAIVYQDVNVPGGGFTTTDFQQFGSLFDDPIYPTDTAVYGQPSDIDGNSRVVILFTPVVNAMTPKGSSSFVAGFFYGCDLVSVGSCSGTNRAEVFYAAVPDPSGALGPVLVKTRILQTTPPVLAHEFMHMISFNQRFLLRNAAQDESLWLSEALAHTAEDTVGGVFLQRGDSVNAVEFMSENWRRANNYLPDPESTTLLAWNSPGTLAERGAGWLFLKYLRGRFGGSILGRLTQTTLLSTANVSTQAGLGWSVLLNDWAVALWADDAPDLAGATLDPRYTFTNINLRKTLGQPAFGGAYLLQPSPEPFGAFTTSGTVQPSASAYFTVTGSAGAAPVALSLAAPRGLPFAGNVVPQLAVMRYK